MNPISSYIASRPAAQPPLLAVRDEKEDLIAQIVMRTNETPAGKKQLARQLAIAFNTLKWSTADLHALLKKANDPTLRSFTAFVKSRATVWQKKAPH